MIQKWLQIDTRRLGVLEIGQEVAIQDPQAGGKSGTVVKLDYDFYEVRVHGSRNLTTRNRQFLRKIVLFIPEEKLILQSGPEVEAVAKKTVLESAERFIAV